MGKKDTVFGFYQKTFSEDFAKLNNQWDLLCLDEAREENYTDPFYHPEVHNEIRMAYSHLARHKILSDELSIQDLSDDESLIEILKEAIARDRKERDAERKAQDNKSGEDTREICEKPTSNDDKERVFERDLYELELDKAKGHIKRGHMDTNKLLYLDRIREEEDFSQKYDTTALDSVDGSNYYKKAAAYRNQGRLYYEQGKLVESLGFHEWASDLYHRANGEMDMMIDYFEKMKPKIVNTEANNKKSLLTMIVLLIMAALSFLIPFVPSGS